MESVLHRYYYEQKDEMFTLGPIDQQFHPGEITFLVGGNGSGKTTLAKLLVSLCPPEEGKIILNGVTIEDVNCDYYRQLFSTIFPISTFLIDYSKPSMKMIWIKKETSF